jgi:hypothetical protein
VVVAKLLYPSEESDIPEPENLGSLLFGFCHLEVFAETHGKEYSYSCNFTSGLFEFGAVLAEELADDGKMDYIPGSPLLSDFFPHVMCQVYLTINVTFYFY